MLSVTTNIGSYEQSAAAAGRGEGREQETVTGVCSNIVTSSNQSITCHYSEHFHHEPQDLCSVSAGAGQESQRYNLYLYTTKYNLFSAYSLFVLLQTRATSQGITAEKRATQYGENAEVLT